MNRDGSRADQVRLAGAILPAESGWAAAGNQKSVLLARPVASTLRENKYV
jgi:hypothetical protein